MLSMLFMSAEGAIDTASDGHPHGDDLAHQVDVPESLASNTGPDASLADDHCEHCCHGHLVSISSKLELAPLVGGTDHQSSGIPYVLNYAQAPPTPPPNA